jgi:hypothetical protein
VGNDVLGRRLVIAGVRLAGGGDALAGVEAVALDLAKL